MDTFILMSHSFTMRHCELRGLQCPWKSMNLLAETTRKNARVFCFCYIIEIVLFVCTVNFNLNIIIIVESRYSNNRQW